jgi:lantibiotic biosynthesis protein
MKAQIQLYFDRIQELIQTATPSTNYSLLAGELGMSLYHLQLYKAYGRQTDAEKAVQLTEQILERIETLEQNPFGYTYGNGLAGLLYMVHQLEKAELVEANMDTEFVEMDEHIFNTTLQLIKERQGHDFLHGAMGIVYYFISRLPAPHIKNYVTTLIEEFCKQAVVEPKGTWFPNITFANDTADMVNFGLAHGNPSFLIILMKAYENDILVKEIPALVETGVQFILEYQQTIDFENNQCSFFPTALNHGTKGLVSMGNRIGWCYGDLNIVLLLYHAGRFLNKPDWISLADTLTDTIILRKNYDATLVADTHFCHGATGVAQFYKHLYELRPLDKYKAAWEYWLQESISLLPQELEKEWYKGKERNFLEGLVGVNLSFLSYLSEQPLNWAAALLL